MNQINRRAARTLEETREELLREYVHGRILLFADKLSDYRIFKNNTEMDSANARVNETHRKLLSTGLSKEAIAYRAKELALKLLDF